MENCCSLTRLGEHCDAMGCQGITLVTCIGSGPELREEGALLISSHGLAGVVLEYWAVITLPKKPYDNIQYKLCLEKKKW